MNIFKSVIISVILGGILSSQALDDRYHSYTEILSLIDSLSTIEEYQNILLVDTIGQLAQLYWYGQICSSCKHY